MRLPRSAAARGFLVGVVVSIGLFTVRQLNLTREEHRLRAALERAEAEIASYGEDVEQIDDFERKKAELEHRVGIISQIRTADLDPSLLIESINGARGEVVIERLSFDRNAVTLAIAGEPIDVVRFAERLLESPHLERVDVERSHQSTSPDQFVVRALWGPEE